MREQGSSTYSVNESGRCLDRLAGWESVITPERIRHKTTGCCPMRWRAGRRQSPD